VVDRSSFSCVDSLFHARSNRKLKQKQTSFKLQLVGVDVSLGTWNTKYPLMMHSFNNISSMKYQQRVAIKKLFLIST